MTKGSASAGQEFFFHFILFLDSLFGKVFPCWEAGAGGMPAQKQFLPSRRKAGTQAFLSGGYFR
jgi:hypothetical protein